MIDFERTMVFACALRWYLFQCVVEVDILKSVSVALVAVVDLAETEENSVRTAEPLKVVNNSLKNLRQ